MPHPHLSLLLAEEMTRKEFLVMSALGLSSILGFGSLIKLLTGKPLTDNVKSSSDGYGHTNYGK